ncbi:lytic transglycosylase [Spirochaetia bacterium]|nr:lytic transglycosylase [Spirochaetia bacterium]
MRRPQKAFCFTVLFLACGLLNAAEFSEPFLNADSVVASGETGAEFANFERALRQKNTWLPQRLVDERKTRDFDDVMPTMEGLNHPLTQSFVERYSKKSGLLWIESVMKNAAPYLSFIRDEIALRGMPPELLYLPVIESGFVPTAKSSSGAAGLWQFMKNSIRPYMSITDYVDERLDFWTSTNAALSKLQENYKQYDDWALSLAAYNSGAGAINGVLKKTGVNDYWVLAEKKILKTESVYYVPKLIAVYYIISNPRKFGLGISWPTEQSGNWVRIPVEKQININLLAEHAGLDKDGLSKANSELLYKVTPATPHFLKVRESQAEAVREVLARDDIKLLTHQIHIIQPGDTLSGLGVRYGVTVEQILSQNPGVEPQFLKLGERLVIPALRGTPPVQTTAAPPVPTAALPDTGAYGGVHIVQKGDTLWSIARAAGIKPETLAVENGIGMETVLKIGRRLKVPQ